MTLQRKPLSLREKSGHPTIPPEVLAQLKDHMHELPYPMMGMVMLLLECGLRVSELCALPFDCLVWDAAGYQSLRCVSWKERSERILPLSPGAASVIQKQQTLMQGHYRMTGLLFLDSAGQAVCPDMLMKQINLLAVEKDMRDRSDVLWRFRAPQFRSTLAALMIEQKVPLQVIQQYFGAYALDMALCAHRHMFGRTTATAFLNYLHRSQD